MIRKPRELLILGTGGHARACGDIAISSGYFARVFYVGEVACPGSIESAKMDVIGSDRDLPALRRTFAHAFVGVGFLRSCAVRVRLFETLVNLDFSIATLICSSAYTSTSSVIGRGTIVMPQSVVGSNVTVGVNSILNSGCIVEHDSQIGAQTHVSTGVIINGACRVGDRVFIGSGSVLRQEINVRQDSYIKMGTAVKSDII